MTTTSFFWNAMQHFLAKKAQKYWLLWEIAWNCPMEGASAFLTSGLFLKTNHVCWLYELWANKLILPFNSAHLKLIKRVIANFCLGNALKQPCPHLKSQSFVKQTSRLSEAGYAKHLVVSVAEKLFRCVRTFGSTAHTINQKSDKREKRKFVVIPYTHKLSHKKIAQRAIVHVAFYEPEKTCKSVKWSTKTLEQVVTLYVKCTEGIV